MVLNHLEHLIVLKFQFVLEEYLFFSYHLFFLYFLLFFQVLSLLIVFFLILFLLSLLQQQLAFLYNGNQKGIIHFFLLIFDILIEIHILIKKMHVLNVIFHSYRDMGMYKKIFLSFLY